MEKDGEKMKNVKMEIGGKQKIIVLDEEEIEREIGGEMIGNLYQKGKV